MKILVIIKTQSVKLRKEPYIRVNIREHNRVPSTKYYTS